MLSNSPHSLFAFMVPVARCILLTEKLTLTQSTIYLNPTRFQAIHGEFHILAVPLKHAHPKNHLVAQMQDHCRTATLISAFISPLPAPSVISFDDSAIGARGDPCRELECAEVAAHKIAKQKPIRTATS